MELKDVLRELGMLLDLERSPRIHYMELKVDFDDHMVIHYLRWLRIHYMELKAGANQPKPVTAGTGKAAATAGNVTASMGNPLHGVESP